MSSRSWWFHVPLMGPTSCILAMRCLGGGREPWRPWSRRSSREETGRLPSAGSCRNSTQTDPLPGKCKVPGGPGEEPGETAGGGGCGVGTLITGNISPGEAGGERPCRGRGTLSEGLEAGGESESRHLGVLQGPWSRTHGVRRMRKTGVGASGGPGDGLRTLHLILP